MCSAWWLNQSPAAFWPAAAAMAPSGITSAILEAICRVRPLHLMILT